MENSIDFNVEKAEHYLKQAISSVPRESNRFYNIIRRHLSDAREAMDYGMARRHAMDALRIVELGHEKGAINNKSLLRQLGNAVKLFDTVEGLSRRKFGEGKFTSPQRRVFFEKTLSTKEKKEGPFALPSKDAYPIPDEEHGENALARAKQFASPKDQATIKRNVQKEFPGLDIEMEPGKPTVKLGPTSKENKKVYD